jgi:hypothetical protein
MGHDVSEKTIKQVEALRRLRGRLNIAQMCQVLELRGTTGRLRIWYLIRRYNIAHSEPDRDYKPGVMKADRAVDLAAQELCRQVALARREMADPRTKPFKVGKLGDE